MCTAGNDELLSLSESTTTGSSSVYLAVCLGPEEDMSASELLGDAGFISCLGSRERFMLVSVCCDVLVENIDTCRCAGFGEVALRLAADLFNLQKLTLNWMYRRWM